MRVEPRTAMVMAALACWRRSGATVSAVSAWNAGRQAPCPAPARAAAAVISASEPPSPAARRGAAVAAARADQRTTARRECRSASTPPTATATRKPHGACGEDQAEAGGAEVVVQHGESEDEGQGPSREP